MTACNGLPPLTPPRMQIAILGSMPGVASLDAQQYYAHPRNSFWALIETLFGVSSHLAYRLRCAALLEAGIGLWDVLGYCERRGSLDTAINTKTAQANDLVGWIAGQPLQTLGLNGTMAARMFDHHCAKSLRTAGLLAKVRVVKLPSSSPANATYSFAAKLAAWRSLTAQESSHQP